MEAVSKRIPTIIGLVLFLAGLGLFAYLGFFNRYWADDWCYNADMKQLGFWGTMKGYTYITTYASNRFSLTLFSGLFYAPGLFGVQIMTLLVVAVWYLGLFYILVNVQAVSPFKFSRIQLALITAVIVYYSIYLTPHLYQSLYWRSGLLPYTAAVVLGVWTFALITHQASRPILSKRVAAATAIVTFLAGGFSESGGATLTAILAAYVGLCLWFRQKEWAKNSLPVASVALFSSILAIAVLIAAPTNAYRVGLYGDPTDMLAFPGRLLYFTSDFVRFSFLDMPLPHLAVSATLFLLGFLFHRHNGRNIERRQLFLLVLFIAFLTFLFVAATYAPSAYIEKSPPAPRTRVISRFILTLGVGMIALLIGYYFGQVFQYRWLEGVAVILLLGAYAYGARSVLITSEKISLYSERAAQWDERDTLIMQSQQQGIREVNVRGIDGLPVGGIRDFKEQRGVGFWINQCAARYYGVDYIYATLP
ncbi:MAG: hypothetical protein ABI621_07500 [Chloroflexota bacterium]